MSKLQIRKVHEKAVVDMVIGGAVTMPITSVDTRLDVRLRPEFSPDTKAYWVNTGLKFGVPEGYVLKIFSVPNLAQNYHARLADGVALVEPGDHSELVLRMIVDAGGKLFEPKAGMVVARAMLEKVEPIELEQVLSFDVPVIDPNPDNVEEHPKVAEEKTTSRTTKVKK